MNTDDDMRRSGWEVMAANLSAEAVLAEALVYARGSRRVTVEHGQPLTEQATALLQQLVDQVDAATAGAGCLGRGTLTMRATSITWTFPATSDVPARELVLAAQVVADRLNPGDWVITADAYV